MPRGYRCIVVALVGWLSLAAAQPKQASGNPPDTASQNVASALNNVATALQRPNEPEGYQDPCEEGNDQRASDLCAQWKAADAARDTASYTFWFGLLGSVIGVLTLGAAGAAALFAYRAARETERAANEAKRASDAAEENLSLANKISEIELRAYIRSMEETFARKPKNSGNFDIRLPFKNVGETPANGVVMDVQVCFETHAAEFGEMAITGDGTLLEKQEFRWGTVAKESEFVAFIDVVLSDERLLQIANGSGRIVLHTSTRFTDEFSVEWVNTHVFYINTHALREGLIHTRLCETRRVRPKAKPKRKKRA